MSRQEIFRKACLIQLSTSCWIGSKTLTQSVMSELGNSDWLKGKKLLINPELLGTIKTTIQKARQLINKSALPFPLNGLYLIPKDTVEDIDCHLDSIKSEFQQKVEMFASYYSMARDEAKEVLKDLFNEADYPMNIREKFRFEWRFLLIDVPDKATILSPEVYEREKAKFKSLMDEAKELSMVALREELGEIVSHMVERLSGNGDGKPKTIKTTMVNRLNEFLDSFGDRNLFNDAKLEELVNQAKIVVGEAKFGTLGYTLNYNEVLRQKVAGQMNVLKTAIDMAIEELPRRKIHLPEPELIAA